MLKVRKWLKEFQSTFPARGGTAPAAVDFDGMTFQSTLPMWGGTSWMPPSGSMSGFQSTLPVWGGTWLLGW